MARRGRCVPKLLLVSLFVCVIVTVFLLTKHETYTEVARLDMERNTIRFEENTENNMRIAGNTFCPAAKVLSSEKVNKLGQFPLRKNFLTIGIASVTRAGNNHYLLETLKSLTENLSEEDIRDIYIVIFLADFNETARRLEQQTLAKTLMNKDALKQTLHLIEAPADFYPPLNNLKKKYNDSPERTRWRSKQNIDYAFLMCYCKDISSYYLHLEDDIKVAPSFLPKLRDFISSQTIPWKSLDASLMGHIGKVYHSADLGSAASLFYLMYDEMPVDWLMMYWRAITSHDPNYNFRFTFHTASLFQHLGVHSSLKGKVMNSTDNYFDKYDHKYFGLNPVAQVTSSFEPHKGVPQDAYVKGIGYFWSKVVSKGDYFQVSFKNPVHIKEVSIETGSNLAQRDILKSADLQVSKDPGHCSEFESIGNLRNGKILVQIHQTVTCLRVLVSQNQDSWVFVREINVWTK